MERKQVLSEATGKKRDRVVVSLGAMELFATADSLCCSSYPLPCGKR
jgi:hypothetical protein